MMQKIGRNDPCHCGSGKKYKNCCLSKVSRPKPLSASRVASISPPLSTRKFKAKVLSGQSSSTPEEANAEFTGINLMDKMFGEAASSERELPTFITGKEKLGQEPPSAPDRSSSKDSE